MSTDICFLSFTHRFDDTRILHKEARSLAKAGFEVTHLAPGNSDSHWEHGVRIEIYPRGIGGILGRLGRFFRLYRRAVQIDADCYHCNEIESWLIGSLIKLFHWEKKVVFDVHEHYPSRFDESRFPKWLRWAGEPAIRLLFRVLTPWTDHLIFAKRSVAPDFPDDEHKQSFIFNYAPLWLQSRRREDVHPSIRAEFEGRKIAVHIGNFHRTKGWPQLLQALARMECSQLDVLCFGGVREGKEVLLAEAQRLGIAYRIHLRERVPYEEMFDYLLCADIGLMLYQPGIQNHIFAFPMKMYDYMLVGLPVIGPDFAVEVEPVVRETECGLLINTAEPEQIAQALDWLCENPSLAREMGHRGREAVIKDYNWESESKKILDLYGRLLGKVI